ncbi:MAG: 16S rRNA (cytosine(1402)-N(4))-methyltransferase RsmH [Campylobacterales bacterium]|nr:16S rRNA (cytosine(1402)-N(4))-methyltransferase RsmH [Campylobacterales bacterium]
MKEHIPHIPVLLDEVIKNFKGMNGGYFVDCTLGYGGHSSAVLKAYPDIFLIGIDRDSEALEFSRKRLTDFQERAVFYKGTFSHIFSTLQESPIVGVLADFGVSSLQFDKLERGFSFESDALDMRMDQESKLSAYEVINTYSQTDLERIFKDYGEIKEYKALALEVIKARSKEPIKSAKKLSELSKNIIKRGKIHPATLFFQAIRIEVNAELQEIELLLDAIEKMHTKGMIVSFITFHSLEDRIVKNRFTKWSKACICDDLALRCTCSRDNNRGKVLHKKPVIASEKEIKMNPRSRSAKLRTFIFTKNAKGF